MELVMVYNSLDLFGHGGHVLEQLVKVVVEFHLGGRVGKSLVIVLIETNH